jgi:hypothetical protein
MKTTPTTTLNRNFRSDDRKQFFNYLKTARALGVIIGLLAGSAHAATLSWSSTAPTPGANDISNFVGTTSDANNINGGNDSGTYIAGNRPQVGQTFTTGGNAGGYTLNAIALQHVQYTSDTTFWSVDAGWGAGNPFTVRIGTISGGTFAASSSETALMVVSGIPALDAGGGHSGQGTAAFFTLTLAAPVTLAPNTTYAFLVDSPGPYLEVNGNGTTDNYGGGTAFSIPRAGGNTGTVTPYTGDRVFVLSLVTNAGASSYTWDGGSLTDNNWTSGANWAGDLAPETSGKSVVFAGSTRLTPNLNTNYSVTGLTFSNNAGAFTLGSTGNTLTLAGSMANESANGQTINMPIATAGLVTLNAEAGGLTVNSNIVNSNSVSVAGSANVVINGALTGGGSLTKSGNNTLTFSGAGTNQFQNMQMAGGSVKITAGRTVANATSGNTGLGGGCNLEVSGGGVFEFNNGNDSWFPIAYTVGTTSTVTVAGGGTIDVDSNWGTYLGIQGYGVLNLSNGLIYSVAPAGRPGLCLGDTSAGEGGTVNLNGGTLQVSRVEARMGVNVFNFNGGTLKPTTNDSSFFSLGTPTVNVLADTISRTAAAVVA